MTWCVPAASKEHRLFRRKRMSKWEQYRHPTRYQPGGSAICGTSGSATAVRVKTGMTSSVRTPFLQLRNPRTFYSRVFCANVSMPCQRVREKESHLSSSRTQSTYTPYRVCDARCGSGSPLNSHLGWWVGFRVVSRGGTPLQWKATCCCEVLGLGLRDPTVTLLLLPPHSSPAPCARHFGSVSLVVCSVLMQLRKVGRTSLSPAFRVSFAVRLCLAPCLQAS